MNLRVGVYPLETGPSVTRYVEHAFDAGGDLRVRDGDSLLTFEWTNSGSAE